MRNAVRDAWKEGRAVVNGWLAIPSSYTAEAMARAGWDSLTVDMQHGWHDYHSMVLCLQAMQASGVTPMVRVPGNDPSIIGKALDAGAMGIICPMINSAEDARALVDACRYRPQGSRSWGPVRAAMYGTPLDYFRAANGSVLVISMIETREAVERLDAILEVPGLDAVYIGPSDLAITYGLEPSNDREEPEMLAIYARILQEAARRGIVAGIHNASGQYAARMIAMGFRLVTLTNDLGLMMQAARGAIAAARESRERQEP
jgi:4-hydroxy-2-oxoheptanedioate aldolase